MLLVREHYTGNKTRNAQVREDLPRAKVEQELEELRYQSYIQQQLVFKLTLICIGSCEGLHLIGVFLISERKEMPLLRDRSRYLWNEKKGRENESCKSR